MIKIYGTKTCYYCSKARDYFEAKDLTYDYIDIGEDSEARKKLIEEYNISTVPFIIVNGKHIIGFDKKEIESALA